MGLVLSLQARARRAPSPASLSLSLSPPGEGVSSRRASCEAGQAEKMCGFYVSTPNPPLRRGGASDNEPKISSSFATLPGRGRREEVGGCRGRRRRRPALALSPVCSTHHYDSLCVSGRALTRR